MDDEKWKKIKKAILDELIKIGLEEISSRSKKSVSVSSSKPLDESGSFLCYYFPHD